MVNWRTYRITSKTTGSNYVLFYLDNYVSYSNGSDSYKHIYCSNLSPFYNWRENDFIEIDNDVTRHRESGYYFGSISEVRLSCHGCGHSQTEYNDLKTRCSALERERNDFRNDRDEWRRKYDEIKEQLNTERTNGLNTRASERLEEQRTRSTLESEKTLLGKDLTNARDEITSLKNLVEEGKAELGLVRTEKDNQIALVKGELTQKDNELKEVEKSMADLRFEHEKEQTEKELQISEKINEIKEKEEKIKRKEDEMKALREKLGLSQEEFLEQKIRLKQEKLDTFAGNLKIDFEQVQNLCDCYGEIVRSRLSYNLDNIRKIERNISKIKQEISRSEISMEEIQKLCRKCEKLASLKSQLDQILEQKYEAKQEVPLRS